MDPAPRRWLVPAAWRALALATVWAIVAGEDPSSWWVGVPAIGLATAVSLWMAPADRGIDPRGLLSFVPFFLWQSLRGAVDVALRALDPRGRVDPAFESWTLRLAPDERPAAFLVAVIGLLPGTLCAEVEGRRLTVHRLGKASVGHRLDRLEERVAALFGVPLEGG